MVNLATLLRDSTHSGCITGICRLDLPKKFKTLEEWIEDKNLNIIGTLSCGVVAFGSCDMEFAIAANGQEKIQFNVKSAMGEKIKGGSILIELNTKELITGWPVYEFKAIFIPK